ncbi:hypothetical protein [Cyanobium gracile]|uniref:Uncharacterized protein n=1 Tax=Cyanobium gracile (strain ATCC 27147 / PCC 6307) TaxID=292564 RepID=K9P291_CYAGP|nr:hypothetical protein [Cyanobium gracile]AFY27487.1 hypothetical protein Cyagr_0288 [Cyanobium gracile PCC 6307]
MKAPVMTESPVKSVWKTSTKALLLVLACTSPCHATTTSEPLPPVSLISCQQSIDKTREWLVSKQAFIPFVSNTRPGRIEPRLTIENGNYSQLYRTYPSGRPKKIVFYLSGDADRIWQGVLGSPQTLTTFASLMMASCPRVGLVEYRHWWEGYLPVGFFPDNTAKAFTWVDASDSRVRDWGFFYSP